MEKIHSVRNPLCFIAHHTAFLHKENFTAKRCSVGISDAYQVADYAGFSIIGRFFILGSFVGCRSPPLLTF